MALSKNAKSLLKKRYCRDGEQPYDVFKRVATALSLGDEKFAKRLNKVMKDGIFLPNSPCLRNAGTTKGLLHACFVLPVKDNMESLTDSLKNMMIIFKHGGGVGMNFSKLRPQDAPLSSGGSSSGVVSFMKLYDVATETVKQGGFRRGALMGVLNFEHDEIMRFISSKLTGNLTNFNISVMVSNKFMQDILDDNIIELKNPQDDQTTGTIGAKTIFDVIAHAAWHSGDPGLLFYDRINEDNKLFPKVKIKSTNPCLTGDTEIETVQGSISIKELIGKVVPVYCYDGKKINIGWMQNVRKTGSKRKIYEIVLDNGKSVKATSDHLFMLRDGSYKKASLLYPGDSLMPFYRYKRNSKGYSQISLNNGNSIGEAQLVCEWKYERYMNKGECVHHIDGNKQNNSPENLEFKDSKKHNSDHIKGDNNPLRRFPKRNPMNLYPGMFALEKNPRWDDSILVEDVMKLRNQGLSQKKIAEILNTTKKIVRKRVEIGTDSRHNHKVKAVYFIGREDVYDGEVPGYNNFAVSAGVVVHNCGEVPLPDYGACCLGSINLSNLVKYNKFDFSEFERILKIAVRALRNMNAISWYPLPEINKVMKELDPIGVGVMGFADCLIKLGIKYDSQECLDFIDSIGKVYKKITDKLADSCFWKRIIAPTGSLSILADCSSGIEPIFDIDFERHLTIGVIKEKRELYKSPFVRIAHDIDPIWHLKIQAKWQEWVDGSISKTINLPYGASIDDIKEIYMQAWKMGCKGITIFRDGSKEGVLKRHTDKKPSPRVKCEGESCQL